MNRNLLKSLVLGLTLFAGAGTASAGGWVNDADVTEIVVAINGGINVRLSPELRNCVSQSGYGAKYASIYPSHPGLNAMHANLLAALAAGKKVSLYMTDNKCTVGEMKLKSGS